MTIFFYQHFSEIKKICFLILCNFFLTFFILFWFYDQCIYILLNPLLLLIDYNYLIITDLSEFFTLKIYLPLFFSLLYTYIFSLFLFLEFISKGLYKSENIKIYSLVTIYTILLIINYYFIYIYLIPHAWEFFLSLQKPVYIHLYNFSFEPKLITYLYFIIKILVWISFLFQCLIVILNLVFYGYIKSDFLVKNRKICYFLFFLVSTIISPPDVFSQLLLSFFFLICFELLIFYLLIFKNLKN